MAHSTFNDSQLWLDNLAGSNEQNQVISEADKRKWSALGETTQPFVKHFNNDGDNDLLTQLGKQGNEATELNLSPSELRQKRKEQNRIAQQNFRQRKNMYLKELEDKVNQLEERRINETKHLQEENQALRLKVKEMEAEIYTLKGAEQAFNLSIQKLREAGIQLPDTTSVVPANTINDSTMAAGLSPSDQYTAANLSSSTLAATPSHSNNNTWQTPPYLSSSPYSASSMSMTGTSSPPLDQSTDHPVYDDNDNNASSSSTKNQQQQSSSLLSFSNSNPHDYNTADSALSEQEDIGFAASETDRFNHQPDPLVQNGAKTIPYTQIWEKVQEHPKYELFDMDLLCEDLKKKARCSGSGAVILEEDFYKLLEKYDV